MNKNQLLKCQPQTSTSLDDILCNNPETEGFDKQTGSTWIYPTNYPLREYQFSIIQEALLKNTLVCLPTGLGKTFIAAVVMYNFYRWYPSGKIIFMAPTKPLVRQQVDACYNIMAIPKGITAELTGTKAQTIRKEVWQEKRVFFITPQVLQNDLHVLNELGPKIKCIVFDEAHKAKGNYAYREVIKKLRAQNKYFRVLALSATPGSSLEDVLDMIRSLLICHIEIRTDESADVVPYVFQRSLETVVVPLGDKLLEVKESYVKILEKYTRVLMQHRIITGNCSMLTKGKIFMTMKDYQARSSNGRDRNYGEIMRNLNICITLYHAFELLIRHGLRGFLSFFEEHAEKPLLRGNMELQAIIHDVRDYLGPAPNVELLPDGSLQEDSETSKFGHPKFYKLKDILLDHFNKFQETRVIVFCEYRESVMEAYALLLRERPLIKPRIFLGQGAITQKQQLNVVKMFKQGDCNTLISTCIGEEGLDVGEVDLIVCFDISNKSPVRMVQRMGRTGRKREGRVVILVTEGKEQQTLKQCLIHKENLTNHILQSTALYTNMYPDNPRMVPPEITPTCQKLHITVRTDAAIPTKKNKSVKDMFTSLKNKKSSSSLFSSLENYGIEAHTTRERLPNAQEHWNRCPSLDVTNDDRINFAKKIERLRVLQPPGEFGHSKNAEMLVSLLQFSESKKYNIPLTQVPIIPTQPSRTFGRTTSSSSLKQSDIRNMFSKVQDDKDIQVITEGSSSEQFDMLYMEIATYLSECVANERKCFICENHFDCSRFKTSFEDCDIRSWVQPDLSILDNINVESLDKYSEFLHSNQSDSKASEKAIGNQSCHTPDKTANDNEEQSMNHEDPFKISLFKPPSTLKKVLTKLQPVNLDDSVFNNVAWTQIEQNTALNTPICSLNVSAFNSAEFTQMKKSHVEHVLSFFNLTTLEEIFDPPLESFDEDILHDSKETVIYSPEYNVVKSPVLCSKNKLASIKSRIKKRLFSEESKTHQIHVLDHSNEGCQSASEEEVIDTSLENCFESVVASQAIKNKAEDIKPQLQISDVIDMSFFGLTDNKQQSSACNQKEKQLNSDSNQESVPVQEEKRSSGSKNCTKEDLSILQEICDDTFIDMFFSEDPFEENINLLDKSNNAAKVQQKDIHSKNIESNDFTKTNKGGNKSNLLLFNTLTEKADEKNSTTKSAEMIENIKVSKQDKKWNEKSEDDWEEDSILNFCLSWTKNKESPDLDAEQHKDTYSDVIKLEENTAINDENVTVIDLTDDSPKKPAVSPTLIKSTQKQDIAKTDLTLSSPEKSLEASPTLLKSQRFNSSKSQYHPLTSNIVKRPFCSNPTTALPSELNKPTKSCLSTVKTPQTGKKARLELDSSEEEFITDGDFNFTFNRKKRPPRKLEETPTLKQKVKQAQTPTTSALKAKNLSTIFHRRESDDDFESPKGKGWTHSNSTNEKENASKPSIARSKLSTRCTSKKKLQDCPFIELEAELSDDEGASSDTDYNASLDKFEESFVDDCSQNGADTTMMVAHYMKTVRSPLLNQGKFKIPANPPRCTDVFSQQVTETENTYINDSFCINTEDFNELEEVEAHEMSVLELAELQLKQRRKEKRKRKGSVSQNKRKRIIIDSSSDSN